MRLSADSTPKPPTLIPPIHLLPEEAGSVRCRIEMVAARFERASHRTAVRCYLYSVAGDEEALKRHADKFYYRHKLRKNIARGRAHLEAVRELYPDVFAAIAADLAAEVRAKLEGPKRRRSSRSGAHDGHSQ